MALPPAQDRALAQLAGTAEYERAPPEAAERRRAAAAAASSSAALGRPSQSQKGGADLRDIAGALALVSRDEALADDALDLVVAWRQGACTG